MIKLINGDCLLEMQGLPDKSIDMILCDLPYGVTACRWDSVIPLADLWGQYLRIIKDTGAIVLFGQGLFSAKLMLHGEKYFRYSLVWQKTTPTGHLNAKKMFMRSHEDLLVFYKSLPTYNPQKTQGHKRKISLTRHKQNCKRTEVYGSHGFTSYDSTERYPLSVLRFASDKQKEALHPTQKPVALLEYLIKTFTNEGETVLDNAMGSGSTGVASINTRRDFIGIELDKDYFEIAKSRIYEASN